MKKNKKLKLVVKIPSKHFLMKNQMRTRMIFIKNKIIQPLKKIIFQTCQLKENKYLKLGIMEMCLIDSKNKFYLNLHKFH